MLVLSERKGALTKHDIWFAPAPRSVQALTLSKFYQCGSSSFHPLFIRETFPTLLIDLRQSEEDINAAISKTPASHIKRARRDGVIVSPISDYEEYAGFYNAITGAIGRPQLGKRPKGWNTDIRAFGALFEDKWLAMHSYICDREAKRARLLHSVSTFRSQEDTAKRNFLGRANRLLHHRCMMLFREEGFQTYDFGGYRPESPDPEIRGIARFKEGFGGTRRLEYHYVSIPRWLLTQAQTLLRRGRRSAGPSAGQRDNSHAAATNPSPAPAAPASARLAAYDTTTTK
ncbi:hypothetical protein [Afifella pfennigii]|uniref:hypothetical protein n=1 Tax=Afifella pfennigii TaxID=209897 RepID=UPI00047EEC0D|nr:hypothetical protein [Afifella pfennigii]